MPPTDDANTETGRLSRCAVLRLDATPSRSHSVSARRKVETLCLSLCSFLSGAPGGIIVDTGKDEAIEFEKMMISDALTPQYDSPLATDRLKAILVNENSVTEPLEGRFAFPVYATARKLTIY